MTCIEHRSMYIAYLDLDSDEEEVREGGGVVERPPEYASYIDHGLDVRNYDAEIVIADAIAQDDTGIGSILVAGHKSAVLAKLFAMCKQNQSKQW